MSPCTTPVSRSKELRLISGLYKDRFFLYLHFWSPNLIKFNFPWRPYVNKIDGKTIEKYKL